MSSKSVENSNESQSSTDIQTVTTSSKFQGKVVNLYQIVRLKGGPESLIREWVVTDLDDGLTLSTLDFESKITDRKIGQLAVSLEPQTVKNGHPMLGY